MVYSIQQLSSSNLYIIILNILISIPLEYMNTKYIGLLPKKKGLITRKKNNAKNVSDKLIIFNPRHKSSEIV